MKNNAIPIIFAFDNNFAKPAYVAIDSLLHYANKDTKYEVYCIINKDVDHSNKELITSLFFESRHQIKFIEAPQTFDNSHQHRGITTPSYYRLLLHELLPDINKVIYADVDVLFKGDLSSLFNIDLSNYLIAGVKNFYMYQVFESNIKNLPYWKEKFYDSKTTYINAGFLIMNLDEIRKSGIWEKWLELSKEKWEFHDQDILNMSCKNRIKFLPPKYNTTYAIRALKNKNCELFTKEELEEKPIVYHFKSAKPWNAKYMKQSDVWWDYVKNYNSLYLYFYERYKKNDKVSSKLKRLKRRIFNKLLYTLNLKK